MLAATRMHALESPIGMSISHTSTMAGNSVTKLAPMLC